jgi:ubiquinol-cytochrome c reductase cytochrome b subunit
MTIEKTKVDGVVDGTTDRVVEGTPPAISTAPSARFTSAAANYIDERTSISAVVKEFGRKIFPDHWSFILGEVAR